MAEYIYVYGLRDLKRIVIKLPEGLKLACTKDRLRFCEKVKKGAIHRLNSQGHVFTTNLKNSIFIERVSMISHKIMMGAPWAPFIEGKKVKPHLVFPDYSVGGELGADTGLKFRDWLSNKGLDPTRPVRVGTKTYPGFFFPAYKKEYKKFKPLEKFNFINIR